MSDQSTSPRPDAVLFTRAWVGPGEFKHTALDRLEPILGVPTYVRHVGGDRFLATRAPADTLLFPHDHPLADRGRYEWVDQPDGARFGTLVPEARE